jgi:hypothetical protein
MTKKDVLTHPVFLALSDGDKKFVAELLENGNEKRAAAHVAWNCKDDASADSMANSSLRKPKVKYLLDEYFGVNVLRKIPSREELAASAWERFQSARDGNEAHKWAQMVSTVMGYNTKPQEAPPTGPETPVSADDSEEEFQ